MRAYGRSFLSSMSSPFNPLLRPYRSPSQGSTLPRSPKNNERLPYSSMRGRSAATFSFSHWTTISRDSTPADRQRVYVPLHHAPHHLLPLVNGSVLLGTEHALHRILCS